MDTMLNAGDASKDSRAASKERKLQRQVAEDSAKATIKDGDAAAQKKYRDANPN
jgi:hypothetical protein